jgi:hypothetical protein
MKINLKFRIDDDIRAHCLSTNEAIVCGRSSSAHITIDDQRVSSTHCRIVLKEDRLEILDLESKNGTYLNGIRIDQAELFFGDEIRIGKAMLRIQEEEADSEALELLSFPGPFKDRISNELKMDFTGARLKNQKLSQNSQKGRMDASQIMEIAARKKIHSKIRLSKDQIRAKYKDTAIMATTLDLIFLVSILCFITTVFYKSMPQNMSLNSRLYLTLGVDILIISFFYKVNFKKAKFSLGERLSGIRKYYIDQ